MKTIKARSTYTEAIGLQLGIVGQEDATEHPLPEFTLKQERAERCQCVKVSFKKFGRQGVVIWCRRGGGAWEMLGIDLNTRMATQSETGMFTRLSPFVCWLTGLCAPFALGGCGQKAHYQAECELLKPQIEERSAFLQTIQDQISRADETVWGDSSQQSLKNKISELEGRIAVMEREIEPIRLKESEARAKATELAKELADYRSAHLDTKR